MVTAEGSSPLSDKNFIRLNDNEETDFNIDDGSWRNGFRTGLLFGEP
jgi:hypothetical protein